MENKPTRTFEEWLEEWCFKLHPRILDDDMSDFFDAWLGELDGEDYMRYADLYGKEQYLMGRESVLNHQLKELTK